MKTRILFLMAVCLFAVSTAFGQGRTIKGKVVSANDGEPLVGVSIMEKGTTNGTTTDVNGNFSLNMKKSDAILGVSYVGFVGQQVKPAGSNVTIRLAEDVKSLDEMVVIGYGVQKKSDLTGAVSSINADDIKGLSTTDAASALQGKAAGIQIINSGNPADGAEIRVRGYSSNSGNLSPLLIVDGLKVESIQYLDPSMIANIEVLKDAASAAIYGAQAGNGVVLITTKSGANNGGTAKISYSFKATRQMLGKKAELFNAQEYIDYQKYLGYINDDKLKEINYKGQDTDWYDEVFGGSWATQHNITVQGGNSKGHLLASLGLVNNDGMVKGKKDTYKRLTAQINADYKFFDWFNITSNTSIEKWNSKRLSNGYQSFLNSVVSIDPLTPAYVYNTEDMGMNMESHWNMDNHGTVMTAPGYTEANPIWYGTSKLIEDATGNPLAMRDRSNATNGGINVRGSFAANLQPIKELTITSRLGYRITQRNAHDYSQPFWLSSMAYNDKYSLSASTNAGLFYQWENFANFNKTFGKHNLGAMVGMSFTKNHWDNTSASVSDAKQILEGNAAPNYRYMDFLNSNGKGLVKVNNLPGDATELAYFGRLSYSFDNRYFVQANFRADAFDSSKLPADKRWGYFPSFSAGWTISNEKFFRNAVDENIVSFLKIRGSWGRNGNINVLNGYKYASTIGIGGYYHFDDNAISTGAPTGLANPDLTWETSEQIDLGLDARFLNNRLTFGLDWYRKMTKDLLVNIQPIPEIGVASATVNSGEVLNSGVDIEIGWRDHIGDLNYSINTNVSTLHNEVKAVNSRLPRYSETGISGFNNKLQPTFEAGHPIWYFRGFKYAGVNPQDIYGKDETGKDVVVHKAGKAMYYDKDGNTTFAPTDEDKQDLGCAIPKVTYGITINLEYKGFDFTLFGSGAAGNKIYNLMVSADRPQINGINTYWLDSWRQVGDNAKYPDMKQVATDWTFFSSSAAVFNGSYFKFKQIQLGYTLPNKITKKAKMSDVRFFVSLDDFFTITKYPGADPETSSLNSGASRGFDNGNYPMSKKVVFGVNLSF